MTEDEAKTKWCPFVRIHKVHPEPDSLVLSNRGAFKPKDWPVNCIASQCMAWRKMQINKGTSYSPDWETGGYCGLAGKT
jgi:hypothetical protein